MPKKGDIIKTYKVVKKIGRGASGDVFLVESVLCPGEEYALKIMENVAVNEELKIGLTLSKKCLYLVKFKEVFQEEDDMYIVMEYCGGGDLSKCLEQKKPLADSEIFCFIYHSSLAIKTLHDAGIIHRDIKLSNFFIWNGGFKLGDYGTARMVSLQTMTRMGTEGYICPEIMKGDGKYTSKADIFSFGITLMHVILGHSPFSASADAAVNLQLAALGTPVDAVMRCTHPAMLLARRMISLNPNERPTIEEVLSFPFLAIGHVGPALSAAASAAASVSAPAVDTGTTRQIDELQRENADLRKENENYKKEIEQLRNAPSDGEHLSFINGWLGGKKKFELLYKASANEYSIETFHERCDHQGATVTVITSFEGYVFGGYAAVPWSSGEGGKDTGYSRIPDASGQSFLFSLKNPRNEPPAKFCLVKKETAILCGLRFGPYFGIDFHCGRGDGNWTELGHCYSNPTGLDGKVVFTGQRLFELKDVEVYAVR